jgi:hypothetical protein
MAADFVLTRRIDMSDEVYAGESDFRRRAE